MLIGNERDVQSSDLTACFLNGCWSLISKINRVSQILEDSQYISKLAVLKSTLRMFCLSHYSAFQLTVLLPSDTISES